MGGKVLYSPVVVGPSSIAGIEPQRLDRANGSSLNGFVRFLKWLGLPHAVALGWYDYAAEGATDRELESLPAQSTERVLEAAKVKAYNYAGLGLNQAGY
jgi:hypothetical protein